MSSISILTKFHEPSYYFNLSFGNVVCQSPHKKLVIMQKPIRLPLLFERNQSRTNEYV